MTYTGRCVGGPLHGELRTVRDQTFRAAEMGSPYDPASVRVTTYTVRQLDYEGEPYVVFLHEGLTEAEGVRAFGQIYNRLKREAQATAPTGTQCLSVQPGVLDFPARCRLVRNHEGPHRSFSVMQAEDWGEVWEDTPA